MSKTNASHKIQEISESTLPPLKAHLKALGKFPDTILHSRILTMTYIASARRGSIIIPDKARDEDRWQGKIGLVIAMGPGAFKDDVVAKFHGQKLKIHDWVLTRPADGMELFFNGCSMRLFSDVDIFAKITDPVEYY